MPPAEQSLDYEVGVQPVLPVHLKGGPDACLALNVVEAVDAIPLTALYSPAKQDLQQPAVLGMPSFRPVTPDADDGPAPMGSGYQVLLQAFNWEVSKAGGVPGGGSGSQQRSWYRVLESKAAAIAEAGVTCVWLPPPSQSVSPEGYMPRELEVLDSAYGSEAELRSCVTTMHSAGMRVMADVVLNHRCATTQDDRGVWNGFGGRYRWDASHICSNNKEYRGRGAQKPEQVFEPAPNVDHSNARVRSDLQHWLSWLRRDVGFDGWRFDFAKGYRGEHVAEYVKATRPLAAVGEWWDDCAYRDGVLEYCQDAHRQRIIDWCDSTGGASAAFDFTTKGVLHDALQRKEYWRLRDKEGKPPGVVGWWPSRAVTFVENHDTGSTQGHWPFPARHLLQGYAYILTHPGTPCLFYDHLYCDGQPRGRRLAGCLQFSCISGGGQSRLTSNGLSILQLVHLRKRNGIHCRSKVDIQVASAEVYAAVIDGKVAVKLGPGAWCPQRPSSSSSGAWQWRVAASGFNYMVWERMPPPPTGACASGYALPPHAAQPLPLAAVALQQQGGLQHESTLGLLQQQSLCSISSSQHLDSSSQRDTAGGLQHQDSARSQDAWLKQGSASDSGPLTAVKAQ